MPECLYIVSFIIFKDESVMWYNETVFFLKKEKSKIISMEN